MVPQEFGPMYVAEMDIKKWIKGAPCTYSSRQNLYQSLIQFYDYRSSIILEKPQWTKMVSDDTKRKMQWSSYSFNNCKLPCIMVIWVMTWMKKKEEATHICLLMLKCLILLIHH